MSGSVANHGSNSDRMAFRHYSLLRKAIMQKRSGSLHFRTLDNEEGILLLDNGEIACEDGYRQLGRFLSSPMMFTEWHDGQIQAETRPALEAVTHAVNQLHWPEEHLRIISVMFSKLPQVRVQFVDVHFDHFLTDISYNLFYQQSLSVENFTPAYFLLENDPSNSLLLHRVRVLVFNYVLGLIQAAEEAPRPKKKKSEGLRNKTPKFAFIDRIIRRIRNIG